MDFITKFWPKKTPQQLMKMGRWVTFIVMVIATAWAPQIVHFEKLWDYLQQALSWFCPPIIALFVMGLFWKKANVRGAYWTIIVGSVITVFSIVYNNAEWKPHFLYMTGWHFLASCIAMVIGSLSGKHKTDEELKDTVWSPAQYRAETAELNQLPWYKNYRIHAVILLIIVAVILLIY